MITETKQFELAVKERLANYFMSLGEKVDVEDQWISFLGESKGKYSPRVDVAVGPFSYRRMQNNQEYNRLIVTARPFLDSLVCSFRDNAENRGFLFYEEIPLNSQEIINVNPNPRCFIAIEIEKSGNRKHRLGDIINACSLGKFGIIIAWNSSLLFSFLRIAEYLSFLKEVDKPTYQTRNLIVVSKEQFLAALI